MKSDELIHDLIKITKVNMNEVQTFKTLSEQELNHRKTNNSWSILECIEHLNRYGDFYIPEIKKSMLNSKHPKSATFKSGFLGNYFANTIKPKEKLNKMKTPKSMNPINSSLDKSVLDRFIYQQEQLLEHLNEANNINLTKLKTPTSLSKWINLRLGDTLRFVIFHNQRHVQQAKRVL